MRGRESTRRGRYQEANQVFQGFVVLDAGALLHQLATQRDLACHGLQVLLASRQSRQGWVRVETLLGRVCRALSHAPRFIPRSSYLVKTPRFVVKLCWCVHDVINPSPLHKVTECANKDDPFEGDSHWKSEV